MCAVRPQTEDCSQVAKLSGRGELHCDLHLLCLICCATFIHWNLIHAECCVSTASSETPGAMHFCGASVPCVCTYVYQPFLIARTSSNVHNSVPIVLMNFIDVLPYNVSVDAGGHHGGVISVFFVPFVHYNHLHDLYCERAEAHAPQF